MFQTLLLPLVTFLVGLAVGAFVGWFAHKYVSHKEIANWERAMITVVVSFAWIVSVILDVALSTYETPVALHGVMGMVVGYFFEVNFLKKTGK